MIRQPRLNKDYIESGRQSRYVDFLRFGLDTNNLILRLWDRSSLLTKFYTHLILLHFASDKIKGDSGGATCKIQTYRRG